MPPASTAAPPASVVAAAAVPVSAAAVPVSAAAISPAASPSAAPAPVGIWAALEPGPNSPSPKGSDPGIFSGIFSGIPSVDDPPSVGFFPIESIGSDPGPVFPSPKVLASFPGVSVPGEL